MIKLLTQKFLITLLFFILITDVAILLNIQFIRQLLGFPFLIILPGLLILQTLKLNKVGSTEKVVLLVGLSISFLMFFGLLINNLSLNLGYETPLATISLLISFNIAFILLAIVGYKINKEPLFSLTNIDLSTQEKVFLIVPVLFPALSILGTHLMKTADNNIILMFLLFLIPLYVAFVCFFNQKFSKRLYPVVIFSISISLLLIFMLRFPHICGHDIHTEYGIFFQTTLDNLHWGIFGHSILDACLSISLVPTIFQSILKVNAQEYLFKAVYVSICSFGPLVIYAISKKYIDELYAFLASFLFMSSATFLICSGSPRTNLAIFFAALAIMVFFTDEIDPLKRRILFIIFMLSLIVSHYSTAYVFLFVILGAFVGTEILSRRYTFKNSITLTIMLLFFASIFLWYSQVTETAFNSSVLFIKNVFISLNEFFIEESRTGEFKHLAGKELKYPILNGVHVALTWCIFILIGIGVLTMLKRYKEMVHIPNTKHKKPDFLKTKFEPEYLVLVLTCAGLLVLMVVLPYLSVGYDIARVYLLVLITLSVCFIIGGIELSKYFRICPYLIILLILIPYFMFTTSVMYQVFGTPASITLNSEGENYDRECIYDQDSYGAKWLSMNGKKDSRIYTADGFGKWWLISQGKISSNRVNTRTFSEGSNFGIGRYIYLNHNNVVNGKLFVTGKCNMSEYSGMFIGTNKIYDNGGSEVYKT